MMQETYVTYEQAKELKKLGFNYECQSCYRNREFIPYPAAVYHNWNVTLHPEEYFSAPTLSLVQKWLREEKKLIITLHYNNDKEDNYWIYLLDFWDEISVKSNYVRYKTYEQALSFGIDKCIEELLKI